MTRRNLLVLVAILISFFTFIPTRPVGACELDANDRCTQMDPAERAAMFRAASAPVPFLDVHSVPTVPRRVCTYPTVDWPMCYALRADGMWERAALTPGKTGANMVVVGVATFDEVVAALGYGGAVAP